MHPTAHMSTPTPYILAPNRSSGERYHLRKRSVTRVTFGNSQISCEIIKALSLIKKIIYVQMENFLEFVIIQQPNSYLILKVNNKAHIMYYLNGFRQGLLMPKDRKKHKPGNNLMCVDSVRAAK